MRTLGTDSTNNDMQDYAESEWNDPPIHTWVGQDHETIETATQLAGKNECTPPVMPIMDSSARPTRVRRRPRWLADYRARAVKHVNHLRVSGRIENNSERKKTCEGGSDK